MATKSSSKIIRIFCKTKEGNKYKAIGINPDENDLGVITQQIATELLGSGVSGNIELLFNPNNDSDTAEIDDVKLISPNDRFLFVPSKPVRRGKVGRQPKMRHEHLPPPPSPSRTQQQYQVAKPSPSTPSRHANTQIQEINDKIWEEKFQILVLYHKENGHCNVPQSSMLFKGIRLGKWVNCQRSNRTNGKLKEWKIERLDSIGFTWAYGKAVNNEQKWDEKFKLLEKYQKENDHFSVPPFDMPLRDWVDKQRYNKKKGNLNAYRIERLESIGFTWSPRHDFWDEKLKLLVAFKVEEGHCNVPFDYVVNGMRLGEWVSAQRTRRESGTLGVYRMERLLGIGFEWEGNNQILTGAGKSEMEV